MKNPIKTQPKQNHQQKESVEKIDAILSTLRQTIKKVNPLHADSYEAMRQINKSLQADLAQQESLSFKERMNLITLAGRVSSASNRIARFDLKLQNTILKKDLFKELFNREKSYIKNMELIVDTGFTITSKL